jgi:hypothetical protein
VTSPGPEPLLMIVAMPDSVHAQRWVKMLRGRGFRLLLLPVYPDRPGDRDACWQIVRDRAACEALQPGQIGIVDLQALRSHSDLPADSIPFPLPRPGTPLTPVADLVTAIRHFAPQLVHSLEVQQAGYLCLAAKRELGDAFPPWLLSNWGSDIYLFRKLSHHNPLLKEIACSVDGYLSECRRDINIARELGYAGPRLDPLPASGGIDFTSAPALETLPASSRRRMILIKGYHNWSGRALHVLSAIHLAAAELRDCPIRVTLATAPVAAMVGDLARNDGIDIEVAPRLADHREVVARMGQARIAVGFGISDGISTSLLEAMTMGAFPIQSDSSCACEWIRTGIDGFILPVHQTRDLAQALVDAARNDALVDGAAAHNRAIVEVRWNIERNGPIAADYYRKILSSSGRSAEEGAVRA